MADEFPAHAFHAALAGGRCSGMLRVWDHGLVFSHGNQSVTLPLEGLQMTLGGAGNRLLFCTHPARPGWQVYTADLALLKTPLLQNHPALQAINGQKRRHRTTFWGLLAGGLGALVLAVMLIWWSLDGMSALAAKRVPVEWEDKLGAGVIAQYRLGKDFMPEKEAAALLAPLTTALTDAMPEKRYQIRFYVVNDPSINAFALPGGHVVIHSALALRAGTAAELQGVLAHEIAHVTEQHGLRAVIRSTGLYVIAQTLLGDASGLVAVMANAGPLLLNQKYSRDFERAADSEGYELLKRARIDPRGLTAFFATIQAEEKRQKEKITDENARKAMEVAQDFLATHPGTGERIAAIQEKLKSEPATGWRDDETAFLALQESVRQFVAASGKEALQ